jgi:PIN domain nuclease of toxin-antitoxin system
MECVCGPCIDSDGGVERVIVVDQLETVTLRCTIVRLYDTQKEPEDRAIVATARLRDLPIVTKDGVVAATTGEQSVKS